MSAKFNPDLHPRFCRVPNSIANLTLLSSVGMYRLFERLQVLDDDKPGISSLTAYLQRIFPNLKGDMSFRIVVGASRKCWATEIQIARQLEVIISRCLCEIAKQTGASIIVVGDRYHPYSLENHFMTNGSAPELLTTTCYLVRVRAEEAEDGSASIVIETEKLLDVNDMDIRAVHTDSGYYVRAIAGLDLES